MKEWVYGSNPVYETLRAGRRKIYRLWVDESARLKKADPSWKPGDQGDYALETKRNRLHEVVHLADRLAIPIESVSRQKLNNINSGHQGVVLEVGEYPYIDLGDILTNASHKHEHPFILILDALHDPQNLGTLLRTAEISGTHGVLLPLRHTASITPAVVSSSSGASEHLMISRVNLAQAISRLKQEGLWVVGLDEALESQPLSQVKLSGSLALVVGNEGTGMRSLVRDSCDILMRLPMIGQIGSLNAATAGSIALYFAWQARSFKHAIDG
jgi:23S rRNA (guanosine2251-2'-O)-methyltransferase